MLRDRSKHVIAFHFLSGLGRFYGLPPDEQFVIPEDEFDPTESFGEARLD